MHLRMAGFLGMILLPLVLRAGEQGHYVPGSWSPRDLISAPSGVMVFAPYVSFYDADKARTGNGDKVDASEGIDVGANSWMFTPVLVYAPSAKPMGAEQNLPMQAASVFDFLRQFDRFVDWASIIIAWNCSAFLSSDSRRVNGRSLRSMKWARMNKSLLATR